MNRTHARATMRRLLLIVLAVLALLGSVAWPEGSAAERGAKEERTISPALDPEDIELPLEGDGGDEPAGTRDSRIIGGGFVRDGAYPFIAALLDTRRGTTTYAQHACGGTLIDASHVLTAAHCVYGRYAAVNPTNLDVLLGRTKLSSPGGVRRDVSRVFVHPWYTNRVPMLYDSAVLRLSSPVTTIRPVSLPAANSPIGLSPANQILTVAGWGNVLQSGGYLHADWLKAVNVPVTSAAWCQQRVGLTAAQYAAVVCAGWANGGHNTCHGDSGGPLFGWTGTVYVQIGTVTGAWGGCASAGNPTWFARMANPSIRAFINAARISRSASGIARAMATMDAGQDPDARLEPAGPGDGRPADRDRPNGDARPRSDRAGSKAGTDPERAGRRRGEGDEAPDRDRTERHQAAAADGKHRDRTAEAR